MRLDSYCVVKDVDALYQEFLAQGVQVKSPPETQEWGMRDMTLIDPDGHELGFGTAV